MPKPVDRGFTNSESNAPMNRFHENNEVIAPMNNQQKGKNFGIFSFKHKAPKGEDMRRIKENISYEKNVPKEWNGRGFDFNCQFPPPGGPVGNERFSEEYKLGDSNQYELEYEQIDCNPPKEMLEFSMSPTERIPSYFTNGKWINQPRASINETTPEPEGPQEDYMDMDGANYQRNVVLSSKVYDKALDIPTPPIRRTISYSTVHSHSLPILRREYHAKIPQAPRRGASLKQTVQKIGHAEEKLKKAQSYYSVSDDSLRQNQLRKSGSGNLPALASKAINNFPKEEPDKELREVLSRRKETIKTLNTREEEPIVTSPCSDDNENVFYQVSDVIANDKSKKTRASPTRVKSPVKEASEKVINCSNPKFINRGNQRPTPPLAKEKQKTPPKETVQESRSFNSTIASYCDQKTEEPYMPRRLINNWIQREGRTKSVTKKVPPPIATKRNSFDKDTNSWQTNSTSNEEMGVVEGKKEINKLVQDIEKQMGTNQKSMLDAISSKSHFPKQLNEYQDPPINFKHVETR